MTIPTIIALRIAIGSALLATCVATSLLERAQSGPGWEVPLDVVRQLTFGPFITMGLIVLASAALFHACSRGNLSRSAIIATIAVLLTAVLLIAIIMVFDPAQWPGRNLYASAVAKALPLPAFAVSGLVFWLIGFYCVPSSSYRGGLTALAVIATYSIGVVLFIAGMYTFLR